MDSKQWIHQSRLEHGWIYTMNGGCVHFHNIDVATVYLQQKILDVVEDTLWGQWQMPSCPDSVWWGCMALYNQETAFVCYLYHVCFLVLWCSYMCRTLLVADSSSMKRHFPGSCAQILHLFSFQNPIKPCCLRALLSNKLCTMLAVSICFLTGRISVSYLILSKIVIGFLQNTESFSVSCVV